MLLDKKLNIIDQGIIITNNKDIIQSCNPIGVKLLNSEIVVGKPIKFFLNQIISLEGRYEAIGDCTIYIFGKNTVYSKFEEIFGLLSVGVFVSDLEGNILLQNNGFSNIFESPSHSIFEQFAKYNLRISSFDILKRAKKEVVFEISIKEQYNYKLKLIPSFNHKNDIQWIYGFITDNHDVDAMESRINKLETELEKNRARTETEIQFNNEKPYLHLHSKVMEELYSLLSNISNKEITILVLGQSGTGKSSVAKAIHADSLRREKPFVTVNCSALSETLIESELFGYKKGAFTGASTSGKKGLVEIAEGGTLFIDEIGEIPLHLQGKLLELLQEKTYRPVGSTTIKKANIRIIVATNKDLLSLVSQKKFREDLYYRIAVAVINIPPLCEHPEDIKVLLDVYTIYFNKMYNMKKKFSNEAKEVLVKYNWPGNIRELEHIIEFLLIRSKKTKIDKRDLPLDIISFYSQKNQMDTIVDDSFNYSMNTDYWMQVMDSKEENYSYEKHLESIEAVLVKRYYELHNSSYKLADYLNISQTKAYRLIKKYCN